MTMEKISIRLSDGTIVEDAGGLQVHISDGATVEIRRVDELVRAQHMLLPPRSAGGVSGKS